MKLLAVLALLTLLPIPGRTQDIVLEAARPVRQVGSTGEDRKAGSIYKHVLGMEWGGKPGHFADYSFEVPSAMPSAHLVLRYARALTGTARLVVRLDGKGIGMLSLPSTGGWGDRPDQFSEIGLALPALQAGRHLLHLESPANVLPVSRHLLPPVPMLERVGNRTDKNTVGHGRNVALYTGTPSDFFYATQNMKDVFSAADGQTIRWFPDYVLVTPQGFPPGNVNLDQLRIAPGPLPSRLAADQPAPSVSADSVLEQRQVCVTANDVVVSRVFVTNPGQTAITHRIAVHGDCRDSADYRGGPGGQKSTRRSGDIILMNDGNVFPRFLANGLTMAIGGSIPPTDADTSTPGAYTLNYDVTVPAGQTRSVVFACAFDRNATDATAHLQQVLHQQDPLERNRRAWETFYRTQVPAFTCSDPGLTELYAFRWFLLLFSRAGGDLGYFKYPVDMEGREAFQTYCCYSAPFMAFDLNWQDDPMAGFGQLANARLVAYDDGRLPWYATPQTNRVPVDHASRTGQSLLPWAAWKFYQIHGRTDLIRSLYPTMKEDVDWWIADRDPDHSGLFRIDDQLETGMDDLHRRWKGPKPARYQAIDATSYLCLNLRAVANMARVLGKTTEAATYNAYAIKAAHALNTLLWDPELQRYRDRNPDTGERTDYNSITIFYPLFAGVAGQQNLGVISRYLLNPKEYRTPWPVPALSQSDPEFDPIHRYWAGPTWPATNSHVVEGFADTARRLDRALLPRAAALFWQTARLHLRPRADFYEHYNSLTGQPESGFRDYMHSWWIDAILRQAAGLIPQDDGSLVVDPLPLGLTHFALRGAPYRGHRVDILWNELETGNGLAVRLDGRSLRHIPNFHPGGTPLVIPATEFMNHA